MGRRVRRRRCDGLRARRIRWPPRRSPSSPTARRSSPMGIATRASPYFAEAQTSHHRGDHRAARMGSSTFHGIAVDADDRVYVADRDNARVQVFEERDGRHRATWSGAAIGRPFAVTVVGERVFVVDGGDQDPEHPAARIVVLDRSGRVLGQFSGFGARTGETLRPARHRRRRPRARLRRRARDASRSALSTAGPLIGPGRHRAPLVLPGS